MRSCVCSVHWLRAATSVHQRRGSRDVIGGTEKTHCVGNGLRCLQLTQSNGLSQCQLQFGLVFWRLLAVRNPTISQSHGVHAIPQGESSRAIPRISLCTPARTKQLGHSCGATVEAPNITLRTFQRGNSLFITPELCTDSWFTQIRPAESGCRGSPEW